MQSALTTVEIPGLAPPRRGKVRDIFDLGDRLLIVATDRISAFDVVLSPGIPDKGKILNQISNFWFREFRNVENHLIETDASTYPAPLDRHRDLLAGRSALVRKTAVVPFECVARGYLAGSAANDYRQTGAVCGIPLPAGLVEASRLPEPIFTPATKAEQGHDENVSLETMAGAVGFELAATLRDLTLSLYTRAAALCARRGIVLADTKLEFGLVDGRVVWIDEAFTPDSSRFWPAASYRPGTSPPSYDKQFVRDWLEGIRWDKKPPAPVLPDDVVLATREKYLHAFREITGAEPVHLS